MKKTCAVVLAISMAILWAGGCQEEQVSPDLKTARLMAVENRDLRAQLQAETKKFNDEIQNLKTQLQKQDDQIKNLKGQLAQCEKARDAKIEEIKNGLEEQYMGFMTYVANTNSELSVEVERLKAELAKVKG
jgi:predicted  nucleic acid-binding Zn-ribbon protein